MTIWRSFDEGSPLELGDCLQAMASELVEEKDRAGRYAVVDATHMHVPVNTRQEIEDGDVETEWRTHAI